jgi:heat shock protein 5
MISVVAALTWLSCPQRVPPEMESFDGVEDFSLTLIRAQLEESASISSARRSSRSSTTYAHPLFLYTLTHITQVVLVGGSARIPKVHQLLDGSSASGNIKTRLSRTVLSFKLASSPTKLALRTLLINVCLLTLSIETTGGVFTKLIPRNTVVPTKNSRIFSTPVTTVHSPLGPVLGCALTNPAEDIVLIEIFKGDRARVKDNHFTKLEP